MAAFNVRLNGKLIDTVFYSPYSSGKDHTPDEVKESLINHDGYHPDIKVSRKTITEHIVQGNYGYGWEDLTSEDNEKEGRQRLREYQENDTASVRLIKRRVKV